MKICRKCKIEKQESDFSPCKRNKDGMRSYCKKCRCLWAKQDREKDPQKNRDRCKSYQLKNADKLREKRANERDKYAGWHREWAKNNREKVRLLAAKRRSENPEKCRQAVRKALKKIRSTPTGKINHSINTLMNRSLRGGKGGRRWELLVGYTVEELKAHLERNFIAGMSWGNYGEWHIDHKIPISVFNFETPEDIDFKKCWSLKNLQPLWAVDNVRKNATIDKPFQPSLNIAL